MSYYSSTYFKLSLFLFILLSPLLFPSHVAAQSDCSSGQSRTYMGVFILDEFGNHWGRNATNSNDDVDCIDPSRRQANITRTGGVTNYLDSHANGIIQKCSGSNGFNNGGFEIRTFRCPVNSSTRMIFDVQPPSSYDCSNVRWRLEVRDSNYGQPVGTVLQTGSGCRVDVPPPSTGSHDTQVIVNLNPNLGPPPRISYQCNSNKTVTLNWESISGAAEYAWRLDNQNTNSNPIYNWYTAPLDQYGYTTSTSATIPIDWDTRYMWAVTASRNPGSHPSPSSWSSAFTCPGPTPTPYVNIRARNPEGQPATVRGMSFTFGNCLPWQICYSTTTENVSFYSAYGYNRSQAGGGIVLYNDQILLGITANPSGGSVQIKSNGGTGWVNSSTWQNYWWPTFPPASYQELTFIVATITPTPTFTITPTATPSPYCQDLGDNGNNSSVRGTTSAGNTSGPLPNATDSCTGPSYYGTSSTTTLTEYACLPGGNTPGGGSTGTSRTSIPITCPYGCATGACNPAPPDIVFNPSVTPTPVTRNNPDYSIPICNTGPGTSSNRYTIRVRSLNPDNSQKALRDISNQIVPDPNKCTTVTVPCSQLGDPFCDESTIIEVTLDFGNNVQELLPDGENNNGPSVFTFNAVADEVFYKLKNASFYRRRNNGINVAIPAVGSGLQQYDSEDSPLEESLVIGSEGIVTTKGNRIRIVSSTNNVSQNDFQKENYTDSDTYLANLTQFVEYAKAQKDVIEITGLNQITPSNEQIYLYTGSLPLNITSQPPAGSSSSLILVPGNVNINISGANATFNNNPNRSIAILSTGTISISSNIATVNAILIGNNVLLGNSPTTTLKINGNLISNTVIDPIPRNVSTTSPNLFVVMNPKMYVDLLPLLSDIILEGRQVE